jgi:hypothetical protein
MYCLKSQKKKKLRENNLALEVHVLGEFLQNCVGQRVGRQAKDHSLSRAGSMLFGALGETSKRGFIFLIFKY